MAQVLYTGKGYQAPRTEGRALQALSQFGTQEQARKTAELQQGFKQRENFMDMLKVDPVYVSSQMAQDRMATSMDNFIDQYTVMNRQKGGKMTTGDMAKMSQARGALMAEMQYLKSVDDEKNRAAQVIAQYPGRYDQQMFEENIQQWMDTGEAPSEGFLFPAIQNPVAAYRQMASKVGFKDVPTGSRMVGDVKKDVMTRQYDPRFNEDQMISDFASSPQNRYSIEGWFDRNVAETKEGKAVLKKAGGDPSLASAMWFEESVRGQALPEYSYEKETAYRPQITPATREARETFVRGNTQYIDKKKAFTKGKVYGAMIAKSGAEGATFHDAETISVPAGNLRFSKELGLPDNARVWVRPVIASGSDIEFAIDPRETGTITISVDEYGAIPKNQRSKYKRIDQADGTSAYEYTERLPENITAVGSIERTSPLLDPLFRERYIDWFGEDVIGVEAVAATEGEEADPWAKYKR